MANKRQGKRQDKRDHDRGLFSDFSTSPLGSCSPMRPPADTGKAPENDGRRALPGLELAAGEDRGRVTRLAYRPTLGNGRAAGDDSTADLPLFGGAGEPDRGDDLE